MNTNPNPETHEEPPKQVAQVEQGQLAQHARYAPGEQDVHGRVPADSGRLGHQVIREEAPN